MKVALVTGASRGLGRALANNLSDNDWRVIVTARNGDQLADQAAQRSNVLAVAGDVADEGHRSDLLATVRGLGRLDLLVNNASELGPTPLPRLDDLDLEAFRAVIAVNTAAPLALTQVLLPSIRDTNGAIVNISSDAAIEAYEGWGGYGASKAALDHLTAVFAVENPDVSFYSFDPGDMRTDMHQAAFPGEDISDRPEPASVVPALLDLIGRRPPSGRYRAADLRVVAS